MQVKMNEMQALIDRRDAVIARFTAVENEQTTKSGDKEMAYKLTSKPVSTETLASNIKR